MASTERRGNGETDREAELNRQRESRLKPTKVFKPSVFVGRSED